MRVVGGDLRSRRLTGPPKGVRPTSDRVREALFARLGDLRGARVLDLFAGTGALAIEALSRGAEAAVLVERSAGALRTIRRNLADLGLEGRAEVLPGDAASVVRRLPGDDPFDLVLLDPPYGEDRRGVLPSAAAGSDGLAAALSALVEARVLTARATVVVEGAKRHPVAPPRGLRVEAWKDYGDTRLTWLCPGGAFRESS
jgi:16S rRNA (guanine966-N2)-methyltransferase